MMNPRILNPEFFIERLKSANSIERLDLLKELIESRDNYLLESLLEEKIINPSEKMNEGRNIIPIYLRTLQKDNFEASYILASYGANLDESVYSKSEHTFGEGHMSLQHYTMIPLASRLRYMPKDVFILRDIFVESLKNGNAIPTTVDSFGMTPIAFLFSRMEFPENKENTNFVQVLIDIISTYVHYGMNINHKDKFGRSCLYYILTKYVNQPLFAEILEYLLSVGIDVQDSGIDDFYKDRFHPYNILDTLGLEKTGVLLANARFDLQYVDPSTIRNQNIRNALLNQMS